MERTTWRLLLSIIFQIFTVVSGATYNVKIGSEFINVVDKNFLSFTVDPKHLFSNVEVLHKKESTCMASFLTPAYLRIAGPSTAHIAFRNTSITIDNIEDLKNTSYLLGKNKKDQIPKSIEITENQWMQFVKWANKTGFDIVFALNNEEKSASGIWDPNSTLTFLSMAEKANIENVFWQLGYECRNQTIDEYLNDLETLRLIVETVTTRRPMGWRTVSGDVTNCVGGSKSDFKDYVTLSLIKSDALNLNGNSSYYEMEKLSESDRSELLNVVRTSSIPLWLTDGPGTGPHRLARAAGWLTSLGCTASSGYHVHYRELTEEELYQPSLSFYMALLFKNLVGDRVLSVDNISDSANVSLFAHCTSLRHKPISGAVTLYGANMDDEPARLSIKLSEREEGGEIMQFILNLDEEGNIIVNGHSMSNEGDIRRVVKRVLPYKTLVINLPARSFGFWVLTNTNIKACHDVKTEKEDSAVGEEINNGTSFTKDRSKRFVRNNNSYNDLEFLDLTNKSGNHLDIDSEELNENIGKLNDEIIKFNKEFKKKNPNKMKRQILDKLINNKQLREDLVAKKDLKMSATERRPILHYLGNILRKHKLRKPFKLNKKRNYYSANKKSEESGQVSRNRRNIIEDNKNILKSSINNQPSMENMIEVDTNKDNKKTWEASNGISNLMDISKIPDDYDDSEEMNDESSDSDDAVIKTEFTDEGVIFKIRSPFDERVLDDFLIALKYLEKRLKKFGLKGPSSLGLF